MSVGLVVVSHSPALAGAARELAAQMLPGSPARIALAAGLADGSTGTDATRIAAAIGEVDSPDGVLVLLDLGSALLSAELALELVEPTVRERVMLSPAPLVEGLVAAAVAAATGAQLAAVAAEAAGALVAKQEQLTVASAPPTEPSAGARPAGTQSPAGTPDAGTPDAEVPDAEFELRAEHGLHARPAALLVQTVRRHDADVRLSNLSTGAGPVPAGSMGRVTALGAERGHRIRVQASGPQAGEAVAAVLALVASGFTDQAAAPAPAVPEPAVPEPAVPEPAAPVPAAPPAAAAADGRGVAASPGVAIGPCLPWTSATPHLPAEQVGEPADELHRLAAALAAVGDRTAALRDAVRRDTGPAAAVFEAHLLLLEDPDLLAEARRRIGQGAAATAAWSGAAGDLAAELAALPDAYQRERAADVRAIADAVLRSLLDLPDAGPDGAGVLVAEELTPAEVAGLDTDQIRGVVLAGSGPTSHTAILARSRGIPLVVAAGRHVLQVPAGTVLAADGSTGEVVVDPDELTLREFVRRAGAIRERRRLAAAGASGTAVSADGLRIAVGANVGSVQQAEAAAAAGADLAGLVRTEFLFAGRERAPDVDEQVEVYLELAGALGGRRLRLRTLDSGADKPLRYLPQRAEPNPALGVRGIRLGLADERLLAEQLLAVVRAARQAPVDLLFPMVATLDELLAARRLLAEAARDGGGEPAGMQVGIMVEVPATALHVAAFAPHVDLVSIGTNDLAQYALAADRTNPAVAALADPLEPGVLRLLDATCRGVADRVPVAVCGELAADETATALLLGLGVRELSVDPTAVAAVKQAVRAVHLAAAQDLAARALQATSAQEVRALLQRRE